MLNEVSAIFRYPGSKWTIAPWIIDHFPEEYEKMVYLEPFAGSLAVFFNKVPGVVEVVNDLDGDIVNFFRVLRERPDELPGWHKDQIPARLTVGMGTETIWMNYEPDRQLKIGEVMR